MRNTSSSTSPNTMVIDRRMHAIEGVNGTVGLTPREFSLLTCLIRNEGRPMSRPDLLRDAWQWDFAGDLKTKTVDMHIRRLRVKLEQAGYDPSIISTVRGRGYAFNG